MRVSRRKNVYPDTYSVVLGQVRIQLGEVVQCLQSRQNDSGAPDFRLRGDFLNESGNVCLREVIHRLVIDGLVNELQAQPYQELLVFVIGLFTQVT